MPEPAMNAAVLLAVWEEGVFLSPIQRGLKLLATAWPEFSADEWARASIGVRDERLLTMREELFGSQLEATTTCPKCGERVETSFSLENIRVPHSVPTSPALRDRQALEATMETPEHGDSTLVVAKIKVETCGYQVECRLPTSADVLEVTKVVNGGRDGLLERCVQVAKNGSGAINPRELPEEVIRAITEEMVRADPQADVRVELVCPVCQHRWSMIFDILSYLWNEIDDWSQRILREVHSLATAYGWSEREILGMSARRRRLYLEIIGT
jgi:hypothetical protein